MKNQIFKLYGSTRRTRDLQRLEIESDGPETCGNYHIVDFIRILKINIDNRKITVENIFSWRS